MEDNNFKIVERAKQSLNFIEQLQEQVTICRRLLSSSGEELTNRVCINVVQELETLLWAKIKNDEDYQKATKGLNEWYSKQLQSFQNLSLSERNQKLIDLWLQKARMQFREILIFIDKKKLMPYGDD